MRILFEMSVRLKLLELLVERKGLLVKRQTQILELTWEAQSVSHIIFLTAIFKNLR